MNKGKKNEYLINNLYNFIKETVTDKAVLEDLDRKYKKSYDQVTPIFLIFLERKIFWELQKATFCIRKERIFLSQKDKRVWEAHSQPELQLEPLYRPQYYKF